MFTYVVKYMYIYMYLDLFVPHEYEPDRRAAACQLSCKHGSEPSSACTAIAASHDPCFPRVCSTTTILTSAFETRTGILRLTQSHVLALVSVMQQTSQVLLSAAGSLSCRVSPPRWVSHNELLEGDWNMQASNTGLEVRSDTNWWAALTKTRHSCGPVEAQRWRHRVGRSTPTLSGVRWTSFVFIYI